MQSNVPTTDEMDKTTPADRYKLVGQCSHCDEFVYFTGSPDVMAQGKDVECTHCHKPDCIHTGTVTSQRSFNPLTAKKRKRRHV
jgi:hypothetical protein